MKIYIIVNGLFFKKVCKKIIPKTISVNRVIVINTVRECITEIYTTFSYTPHFGTLIYIC